MKFIKMQGLGNDYVYVDCLKGGNDVKDGNDDDNCTYVLAEPSKTAAALSDRHFGIGSDGLVLILPSTAADFRMRMFNPDGTEAEMCGNAIRCVGKYLYDNRIAPGGNISIETGAGIKKLVITEKGGLAEMVTVDMGMPELRPCAIPVADDGQDFIARQVRTAGYEGPLTAVSMGNPHAVIYVDSVDTADIAGIGPEIEKHRLFPRKTNVEFVSIAAQDHLIMRVWERGTGETMACGTGACAALVSSVLNGFCGRAATVTLPGGDLYVEWKESDGRVYMTGPAVKVFEGEADFRDLVKKYHKGVGRS